MHLILAVLVPLIACLWLIVKMTDDDDKQV